MSNKLLAAAAALAAGAVCLGQVPALAGDGGIDAQATVKARQSAFMLSAGAFGGMKGAIDSGAEVKPLTFGAKALARWARTLPSMFPAGTGAEAGVPTKAKPEIWSDRAAFEARAADYAAAADKLAAAAEAGDKAAFAAAWTETRATCSACHDRFRAS